MSSNRLTSVPAEIGQLTSLVALVGYNRDELASEIGQLTSLECLELGDGNPLTSVPAEIGQLTSLKGSWRWLSVQSGSSRRA